MKNVETTDHQTSSTTNSTQNLQVGSLKEAQITRLLGKATAPNLEIIRRLRIAGNAEPSFAMDFSGTKLLGLGTATLAITEGNHRQSEQYFFRQGEMPLSHLGGENKDPVLDVTERIGLKEGRPEQQVRGAVTGKSHIRTEFTSLVPILARAAFSSPDPNRFKLVVEQGITMLDALHDRQIRRPKVPKNLHTLKTYCDLYVKSIRERKGGVTSNEEKALQSLSSEVIRCSMERKMKSKGELSYMVESMLLSPQWASEVHKFIYPILEVLLQEEVQFWDAVEECGKQESVTFNFERRKKDGRGRFIRKKGGFVMEEGRTSVLFVQSDNPRVVPASRHPEGGGCGITVVRNSRGNIAIFCDRRLGLNHDALFRSIQAMELMHLGWKSGDIVWEELGDKNGHPELQGLWVSLPEEGIVANGLTQTDVTPTTLTPDVLTDRVVHSYFWSEVKRWMREVGIPLPGRTEAEQPVAENTPEMELLKKIFTVEARATTEIPSTTDVKMSDTSATKPAKAKRAKKTLTTVVSVADLERVLETASSPSPAV
ncbi:MAG: hypothetical protein Q7R64_00625 [bacterium]|nr:hypothetical protein [bacterium]